MRKFSAIPINMSYKTLKIDVPKMDPRKYGQIVLSNGLVATLVQDISLNRCSCALAVKVGASKDPENFPGLAHLTEHMLFLGTEKYSLESYYKNFLNKNGGTSNASTSMEITNYNFDINHVHFDDALDIFSSFFKRPLFDINSTSRELRAVDSEDSKNRINDSRRMLQILKTFICRDCSYSNFSTGNLHTLVDGDPDSNFLMARDAMKKFYEQHYHSVPISVALLGPQSIDQLADFANRHFSDIVRIEGAGEGEGAGARADVNGNDGTTISSANTTTSPQDSSITQMFHQNPIYPLSRSGCIVRIAPVKDISNLTLVWPVPPLRERYRNDPSKMAGFLLGHEGMGSAFDVLQNKGWLTSLSAGIRTHFESFSLFEISISLTPAGFENWKSIVTILYSFIGVIEQIPDETLHQYWKELRTCNELIFQYKQKSSPRDIVSATATNTLYYAPEHALSAGMKWHGVAIFIFGVNSADGDGDGFYITGYVYDEDFDLTCFRELLSKLQSKSSLCFLQNKAFGEWISTHDVAHGKMSHSVEMDALVGVKANRIEPWYGIHFHEETMSVEDHVDWSHDASACSDKLMGPANNVYVPYELLRKEHSDLLAQTEEEVWPKMQLPIQINTSIDGTALWWTPDLLFRYPRSIIHALVHRKDDMCEISARKSEINYLISEVSSQLLSVKRYPASVAGLQHHVDWTLRGCSLTVYGFTPRIPLLFGDMVADLFDSDLYCSDHASSIFENVKEKRARRLKSWSKERPDAQASALLSHLLQDNIWSFEEKLEVLESITFQDVIAQMRHGLQHFEAGSVYIHGSITQEHARAITNPVFLMIKERCDNLKLDNEDEKIELGHNINAKSIARSDLGKARLLPCGVDQDFLVEPFNQTDENSALIYHIQSGEETLSPRVSAALLLLNQFMKEPLFTNLRTTQQIGYIVSMSTDTFGSGKWRMGGLTFTMLSKRFHPVHIKKALGDFLLTQEIALQELTQEELTRRALVVASHLEEPPQSYTSEAASNWSNIVHNTPIDYKQQAVIQSLKSISLSELQLCASQWIFNPSTRRSASIMICAENKKDACVDSLSDVSYQSRFFTNTLTNLSGEATNKILQTANIWSIIQGHKQNFHYPNKSDL